MLLIEIRQSSDYDCCNRRRLRHAREGQPSSLCYQDKSSFFTISLGWILTRCVIEGRRLLVNFQNVGVHSSLSKTHTTTTAIQPGDEIYRRRILADWLVGWHKISISRSSKQLAALARAITLVLLFFTLLFFFFFFFLFRYLLPPRNIIIVITRKC